MIGLHRLAGDRAAHRAASHSGLSVEMVRSVFPRAATLRPLNGGGLTEVLDADGRSLGSVATTSPEADRVVGYSGPNNVLLALSDTQEIQAAELLASEDTRDHVALVKNSARFWQQFNGMAWGSGEIAHLDGVSGATLTSLAIAEAIVLRMSGRKPSLRFPAAVSREEAQTMLAEADELVASQWQGLEAWEGFSEGVSVGWVLRTGTLVDSIEGYQGPTELLLWLDPQGLLRKATLRGSYDNQPYVRYVQQEASFWPLFQNRDLADLANMNFQDEVIEGVSGATMTSMAVAETIQAAAEQLNRTAQAPPMPGKNWNSSLAEIATALLAVLSIPWSRSRWRTRKFPRRLWQLTCFVVIGLYAGNLLSLALLAGWTRGGVPLHLAPGLTTLLVVALVWPAVSKQNVYCDHVCPHGTLQQWLRPLRMRRPSNFLSSKRRMVISKGLVGLSWIGILIAVGWLASDWPISLSALEPFDTYAWRIGLSLSSLVWLASLLLVWWRPMAYCQLACPTGRILDSLRLAPRRPRSWVLDAWLAVAVAVVWGVCTL